MKITVIFLIVAIGIFLIAAFGLIAATIDLVALGLAFFAASFLPIR